MIVGLVLSSTPGYSETFLRNKIRFLTEAGIKVIVFVDSANGVKLDRNFVEGFSWNGNWQSKARKIIFAISRLAFSPIKAYELYKLNKQCGFLKKKNILSLLSSAHVLASKIDWLHFGFATTALGRENLARVLGARMAVSIRGFDIAIYPLKHSGCYKLLWERLDKLHYISEDLFVRAEKEGFRSTTAHQKIRPAIDAEFYNKAQPNLPKDKLRFLTIARLHWIKGLEYTLMALRLVRDSGVDFEYTIIGEGDEYDRLIFAAHQMKLLQNVRFVGKKSPEEIRAALNENGIYLQYSIHEGFCNAVIEAQAAGLLTIVSDAGGLPENVLHGETGWVVPRRNPRLLADRILAVLNTPKPDLIRISRSAMTRARLQFDLKQQKEDFVEFYR